MAANALAPNSLAARDVAYTVHPYTDLKAHEEKGPMILTRGEGVFVWDDDGKRYLEGLAGLWCTSLGFSEPRLVEAARAQLQTLPYSSNFFHRSNAPLIELSEKLVQLAPEPLRHAFFVCSGSEATDTALKFVWYYHNAIGKPEKKKIISRKRGYHGVTVAAASMTGLPLLHNAFDLPIDRILHTETPSYYRNGLPGESEEDFATRLAESLEEMIQAEGPETVGAFIAEPVMGAGGVIVPPRTYFEKVQAVLKSHDILMIADEVICGFGRTGNMWGSQTFHIQPDLMTCAKQLSSAYLPIAGVLISDPIYEAMAQESARQGALGMGYTYGGHPVSAAVALETLKIYEERDIVSRVRAITPHFQERLNALQDCALVGEARGVGLVGAVELVADKATKVQFPPERKAGALVADKALDHGLILRGLPGDAVAACPPLIIEKDEIDMLFDAFEAGLKDAEAELV